MQVTRCVFYQTVRRVTVEQSVEVATPPRAPAIGQGRLALAEDCLSVHCGCVHQALQPNANRIH